MNSDLLNSLNEIHDPKITALVNNLQTLPQYKVSAGFSARVMAQIHHEKQQSRFFKWLKVLPLSAAALLTFGFVGVYLQNHNLAPNQPENTNPTQQNVVATSTVAPYIQAFTVSSLADKFATHPQQLREATSVLIQAQHADGGWDNPRLTVQNVSALGVAFKVGLKDAKQAYRQGLRYLRLHGLKELTNEELKQEANLVYARLNQQTAMLK